VFPVTSFVGSTSLSCFLTADRCARLRLPYSGSFGPQFPTYWYGRSAYTYLTVLRSAKTTHRPSRSSSLFALPPIPCILLLLSCPVSLGSLSELELSRTTPGDCFRSVPLSLTFGKEAMSSPRFPSYPHRHRPRSQTPVVSCPLALSCSGLLPSIA
jgi:hypothetical protein